jgi:hypothetical protein
MLARTSIVPHRTTHNRFCIFQRCGHTNGRRRWRRASEEFEPGSGRRVRRRFTLPRSNASAQVSSHRRDHGRTATGGNLLRVVFVMIDGAVFEFMEFSGESAFDES